MFGIVNRRFFFLDNKLFNLIIAFIQYIDIPTVIVVNSFSDKIAVKLALTFRSSHNIVWHSQFFLDYKRSMPNTWQIFIIKIRLNLLSLYLKMLHHSFLSSAKIEAFPFNAFVLEGSIDRALS